VNRSEPARVAKGNVTPVITQENRQDISLVKITEECSECDRRGELDRTKSRGVNERTYVEEEGSLRVQSDL
jgi:hypothetical protein